MGKRGRRRGRRGRARRTGAGRSGAGGAPATLPTGAASGEQVEGSAGFDLPAMHPRDRMVADLWTAYRERRDARALDGLVVHYIPLVRSIARRAATMLPPAIDREDLVSDGTFGLMDAIRRYDPATGHAFSTYATSRIRGAILDGLRAADWAPRSLRAAARSVEDATEQLTASLGRRPTEEEIAVQLHISLETCRRLVADIHRASTVPLEPSVEDEQVAADPTEGLALVLSIDRALPPREAMVVRLHDLLGYPLTIVAARLDISHSRAFQIHERALDLLRRALRNEGGDPDA